MKCFLNAALGKLTPTNTSPVGVEEDFKFHFKILQGHTYIVGPPTGSLRYGHLSPRASHGAIHVDSLRESFIIMNLAELIHFHSLRESFCHSKTRLYDEWQSLNLHIYNLNCYAPAILTYVKYKGAINDAQEYFTHTKQRGTLIRDNHSTHVNRSTR